MARLLLIVLSILVSVSSEAKSTYVPDQVIVQFEAPFPTAKELDSIHATIGAKADSERRGKLLDGMELVKLPHNVSVEEAIKYYSNPKLKGVVRYSQPNHISGKILGWPESPNMSEAYILSLLSDDPMANESATTDPLFNQQWALVNNGSGGGRKDADINILVAWEHSKGSKDIIVAVVDTGVDYLHPDLMDNIWINEGEIPGDGVDNDGNGYIDDVHGYNMLFRNSEVMDVDGHGTHVSGTIGALTNNNIGVAGINWNVRIMAIRTVPGEGDETDADVIESYIYAAKNGARVINCSFGKSESSTAVKDAIDEVGKVGVLVVAAAGNEGNNVDENPSYPAAFTSTNLLTVAATTKKDSLILWSNYGVESVDIGAPGVSIISTVPDNSYAVYSGTSMATPHVVGAAALLLSINPDLNAEEIKDILMTSSTKLASLSGMVKSGGRLNLGAAVGALLEPEKETRVSP